jgi:hypothetical protein
MHTPRRKVRNEPGHRSIVTGQIDGSTPLCVERYLNQAIDRTVAGVGRTGLAVQFGGGRVRKGEPDHRRRMNLPIQSLLVPKRAHPLARFRHGGLRGLLRPRQPQQSRAEPGSAGAVATRALTVRRRAGRGRGAATAGQVAEESGRRRRLPGTAGRHHARTRVSRLDGAGNGRDRPAPGEPCEAARRAALGAPPHRYVLSARPDLARNHLTQSTLSVSRVAGGVRLPLTEPPDCALPFGSIGYAGPLPRSRSCGSGLRLRNHASATRGDREHAGPQPGRSRAR